MEGKQKPNTVIYGRYGFWNYDSSCMLTLILVCDSENFWHLIFVAQSVQYVSNERQM